MSARFLLRTLSFGDKHCEDCQQANRVLAAPGWICNEYHQQQRVDGNAPLRLLQCLVDERAAKRLMETAATGRAK